MHLTNYSIQKKATNYNKEQGCKWSIHGLKVFLISKHGNEPVALLFSNIQDLIIRSLLSVQQTIIQDKHSFELYGYDVLFDENLKPWLIEVNASPSLTGSSQEDYHLKYDMLNDLVEIIDIEGNQTGDETRIGGFDLVWNGSALGDNLSIPSWANIGLSSTESTKRRVENHEKSTQQRRNNYNYDLKESKIGCNYTTFENN